MKEWLDYFRGNQKEPAEIPWESLVALGPAERNLLSRSLRQFQLGEGATGAHFLERARTFAKRHGDWAYVEALALFVGEEQRHSALLARYLRETGIGLCAADPVDRCFRKLRKLSGLECMVSVLVTAEIIAVPYYKAVLGLTQCPVLRALCRRILREEAQHLRFQADTLQLLVSRHSGLRSHAAAALHALLLLGACQVVWIQHRAVFRAAGVGLTGFAGECFRLWRRVRRTGRARAQMPAAAPGY